MDERALTLVFLLLAGVLPLRSLAAQCSEQPERRNAVRALWIAYALVAVGAVAALFIVSRREQSPAQPSIEAEQLARAASACAQVAARA